MKQPRKPRRVIASSLATHRVYRGANSVNVVKTYQQVLAHKRACDSLVQAMQPGEIADIVYFPQRRRGSWRENVTIRP